MTSLLQDVRYALRALLRAPGFTLVSSVTLALGMGASLTIFSFLAAVLAASAPVRDMDRLAAIWSHDRGQAETKNVVSLADFIEWKRRARSFDRMAATERGAANLADADGPLRVAMLRTTADYFDVLGIRPALGRPLTPADEVPGAPPIIVLPDRLWRDRFRASPAALGRSVRVDGVPATIVGVMPPERISSGVIVPLTIDPAARDAEARRLFVLGRLAPGVTLEHARAEMTAIAAALERERPADRGWTVNTRPLAEEFLGSNAKVVFAMLGGAVLALLLIGCANVANLTLVRGAGRARELAVRAALGAHRAQLVRQLLAETLLVSAAAGVMGVGLGAWGLTALQALLPTRLTTGAALDRAAIVAAVILSLAVTVIVGLVPALRVTGGGAAALHAGAARRIAGGGRLRETLVGVEVALAVTLLIVAGLLARTLVALERVEPGFEIDHVLTARLSLPPAAGDDAAAATIFARAVDRIAQVPGVTLAAATSRMPVTGSRYNPNRTVEIDGSAPRGREAPSAQDLTVTPAYFRAFGIPVKRGREFSAADGAGAPLVTAISDAMARRYWPGRSPLGARIRVGGEAPGEWRTVVAVVGDVRNDDIDAPPVPHVYLPLAQQPRREMSFVIRTSGEPAPLADAVRNAVLELDRHDPLYDVATMRDIVERDLRDSVVLIDTLVLFALVALLLAGIGVYGVVSCAVAQRTQEIGVRMALGASAGHVLKLVVRQGLAPVVAGLAAGVASGVGLSHLMAAVLYKVRPGDPVTVAAVAGLLFAVAVAAAAIPARRATTVDPLVALRAE